jgi:enoyl-CoA hydratase/carnithine racemase
VDDGELVGRKAEEDGVELLLLRHPPVNAISTPVLRALDGHARALAEDPRVRAVVLAGEGQYFSAGADVKEMGSLAREQALEMVRLGREAFRRLAELPVPVIASIQGLAVGGGLELALACDLRVAGESAKFGAPETTLGLIPAWGGTQRLSRLVGATKAKELVFLGGLLPSAEALRIGLVTKVVPAGQELRAARDLAHTIGQRSPRAVRAAKRAIAEGSELALEEGVRLEGEIVERELLGGPDLDEGVRAFLEHRPPKFRGG